MTETAHRNDKYSSAPLSKRKIMAARNIVRRRRKVYLEYYQHKCNQQMENLKKLNSPKRIKRNLYDYKKLFPADTFGHIPLDIYFPSYEFNEIAFEKNLENSCFMILFKIDILKKVIDSNS